MVVHCFFSIFVSWQTRYPWPDNQTGFNLHDRVSPSYSILPIPPPVSSFLLLLFPFPPIPFLSYSLLLLSSPPPPSYPLLDPPFLLFSSTIQILNNKHDENESGFRVILNEELLQMSSSALLKWKKYLAYNIIRRL